MRNFIYQYFVLFPVFDELLNIANLHILFSGKLEEVVPSCHCSVIIHDFTAKACRFQSCKSCKIDSCFRVALTFKNAPFSCLQREKMAGSSEIFRFCSVLDCFKRCHGAGISGNSRTGIFIIDRFQECCLVIIRIMADHRTQVQGISDFFRHRHADDAFCLRSHAVHIFRSSKFCGANIIAFIFSGLRILHDDNVSCTDFFNDFFNTVKFIIHNFLHAQGSEASPASTPRPVCLS